jgi:hypothetical protein
MNDDFKEELKDCYDEITRLKAEVERLRRALEPFANLTVGGKKDTWSTMFPRFYAIVQEARAALTQEKTDV